MFKQKQLHDIVKAAGAKEDGAKPYITPETFEALGWYNQKKIIQICRSQHLNRMKQEKT